MEKEELERFVIFCREETAFRYRNGKLITDEEWFQHVDRIKNSFVQLENISKETSNATR